MVTCQSANQLKTPAKVSWAFKMASQFGSLGYTIMGKTADLTVVQKTIIDTLHKEGKPQTFIAKEAGCSQSAVSKHVNRKLSGRKKCGRKDAQPIDRTTALWGLSSKIDSRIWVNFTRNGLRLGSRHQEPPHTDVSRNLATVVVFLLLSHSWTTDNVRGVLPGLMRRRTGLLPSGPKSSFQMRASFVFHLETKVLESGGRVEKLIAQVAWSPVLSFHSLWWFGVQCHLLVLVHCVFLKTNVTAPVYQEILEHFMLPFADFIFQQDLAPAHTAKSTKRWPWCWCAWLASKLTRPEPHRESMGYCQEENEKQETKKCRWPEGHCQRNLGFHTTSAVPQTDHLHATPNWGSN